jgi:tRNA (adenine37-N6)-methyltransferase
MKKIVYEPIGIIHSPFKDIKGMPIQPTGAKGIAGTIEIHPEFAEGLKDLEGFSHIILIYHFHLSKGYSLKVKPFMDENLRGVFATRAPKRPNPIGISVVKLRKIEGNILNIEDVDIIDCTPLLDIKPYVPEFDVQEIEKIGWLSQKAEKVHKFKSDERFQE